MAKQPGPANLVKEAGLAQCRSTKGSLFATDQHNPLTETNGLQLICTQDFDVGTSLLEEFRGQFLQSWNSGNPKVIYFFLYQELHLCFTYYRYSQVQLLLFQ